MIYTIQAVKSYGTGGRVEHWPEDTPLGSIVIPDTALLGKSSSVEYSVDAFQPRASVANVGHLALELDAANEPRWIPESGWLQSDRDHRLVVSTDAGLPIWSGHATGYKMTKTGTVRWQFESHWQELDDINISADPIFADASGDEDIVQSRVAAEEIMEEVRGKLPIWPSPDTRDWLRVYRPEEDEIARDYVGRLLLAQRVAAVPSAAGGLEIIPIEARSAVPVKTLRTTDVLSLQVLDGRRWQWNSIRYEPHQRDDERLWQGDPTPGRAPRALIERYGVQELRLDLDRIGLQDARVVADRWQRARMHPRDRVRLRIAVPQEQILALHLLRLELDAVNDIPIPLHGDFLVVGVRLSIAEETMDLTLERWLGPEVEGGLNVPASMIPEPPTNVAVRPIYAGLVVTWRASSLNGEPVLRYQIRHQADGASGGTIVDTGGPSNAFRLEGLIIGLEYQVEVRAVGASGVSEWSERASGVPLQLSSDPPRNVQAQGISSSAILLTWDPPADYTVQFYQARIAPSSPIKTLGDPGAGHPGHPVIIYSGTSVVFTQADFSPGIPGTSGLGAGETYYMEVRAFGPTGIWSDWSPEVSTETLQSGTVDPETMQAPPENVTAAALSDSVIRLSWDAPADDPVASYEVRIDGGAPVGLVASATSYDFTGLTAGTNYTAEVRALAGGGVIEHSNWVAAVATTDAGPPDYLPPRNFRGVQQGLTSIAFDWDAPTSGNPDFYWLQFSPGPGYDIDGAETDFTANFLTNGTTYRIDLYAGAGAFDDPDELSAPQTILVTLEAPGAMAPGVPGGVNADALSTTAIELAWDGAAGVVTGYEVRRSGLADTSTLAASARFFDFTGLAAGTEYTLGIRALGEGGTASAWVEVQATTEGGTAPPPQPVVQAAPSGLAAGAITEDSIAFTWNDPAGGNPAGGYEARWTGGGSASIAANANSHTAENLAAATEYLIELRALGGAGVTPSAWVQLQATTDAAAPTQLANPGGVTATALGETSLRLAWQAVAGATSYSVRIDGGATTNVGNNLSRDFTGLAAGTSYELEVRANGGAGTVSSDWVSATATTDVEVPAGTQEPPRNVTATALGLTSVRVDWQAPSTGAPARDYRLRYRIGSGAYTAITLGPSSTSHTFNGLAPGTLYSFEIRARDNQGLTSSAWITATATTQSPAQAAPSGLAAGAITEDSIGFTWNDPAGGNPAGGYEARWTGGGSASIAANANAYTINNLPALTAHLIELRALGGAGVTPSAWVQLQATTAGSADPTDLTATALSATTVRLDWTAPEGGSPAAGYTLQRSFVGTVYGAPGSGSAANSITGTATSQTVGGLAANTAYDFRLGSLPAPLNLIGPATVTTDAAAPTNVTAAALSISSIRLNWDAPAPAPAADGYEVRRSGALDPVAAADGVTSHTFTGLDDATAYTASVRSTGGGNPSAWVSASATTETATNAPTNLTVEVVDHNTVNLAWDPPNGNFPAGFNGPIWYDRRLQFGGQTFILNENVSGALSESVSQLLQPPIPPVPITHSIRARYSAPGVATVISDWSNSVTVTLPPIPGQLPPRNLTAVYVIDQVTVTWDHPLSGAPARYWRGNAPHNTGAEPTSNEASEAPTVTSLGPFPYPQAGVRFFLRAANEFPTTDETDFSEWVYVDIFPPVT